MAIAEYVCDQCGELFAREARETKSGRHFCKHSCATAYNKAHPEICSHHGGSVTKPCAICRKPITKPRSLVERRRGVVVCPGDCCRQYKSLEGKKRVGPAQSSWKGGPVEVPCIVCGKPLMRTRAELARNEGRAVCPRTKSDCWSKHIATRQTAENHWNWKGGPQMGTCADCGIGVTSADAGRPAPKRCPKCHHTWRLAQITGKNNPNWKGDDAATEHRYRWYAREGGEQFNTAVRKRDRLTCAICGKRPATGSGKIHVHHKAGFAAYPPLRSVSGNGVCLCKDCHTWTHSNAGRAQREAWEAEALAELGHLLKPAEEEEAA